MDLSRTNSVPSTSTLHIISCRNTSFSNEENDLAHCRFCAESKAIDDLLNFGNEKQIYAELDNILELLSVDYIDLDNKKLPKTVCQVCYTCLKDAYWFFLTVKRSQIILNSLYSTIKQEPQDECSMVKIETTSHRDEVLDPIESTSEQASWRNVNSRPNHCEVKSNEGKNRNRCVLDDDDFGVLTYGGIPVFNNNSGSSRETSPELENVDYKSEPDSPIDEQSDSLNIDQFSKTVPLEIEVENSHSLTMNNLKPKDISWTSYRWKCLHCKVKCESMLQLREHSKGLHVKCYGFSCVDCTETFNTFNAFVEHVRQHRDSLRLFCQYCNQKFMTAEQCSTHTFHHWSNNQKICSLCGEICPDAETLKLHNKTYKRTTLARRDYRKKPKLVSQFVYGQLPVYEQKAEDSWKDYDWACSECWLRVGSSTQLRRHAREFHGKCFAMKCCDCLKTVDNFRVFVQHVTTHRPYLKNYCQYCDLHLSDVSEMDQHVSDHMTSDQKPCDGCGEMFQDNDQLNEHIKQYDPPRRRGVLTAQDLTCEICNKAFKLMSQLRYHKENHTKNRKRDHICDNCGKAFYTKNTLNNHAVTHSSERKEVCKICGRGFKTVTKLKRHVLTHTDSNQFTCDVCGKSFKLKHRLKCHIETHMDYKKYKCTVCGKKFKHGGNLKIHMYQHTGQRPYCCQYCEKAFTNWANCNKHTIRKHGVSLAKTKRTPQGSYNLDNDGVIQTLATGEKAKEWMAEVMKSRRIPKKKRKGEVSVPPSQAVPAGS